MLQVALPERMLSDINSVVENSQTAKICEAVRTITLVIQFLAKVSPYLFIFNARRFLQKCCQSLIKYKIVLIIDL